MLTVAGLAAVEENTAATGAPTIEGMARVGEVLTTSTADIADADGLERAAFVWQWLRDDAKSRTRRRRHSQVGDARSDVIILQNRRYQTCRGRVLNGRFSGSLVPDPFLNRLQTSGWNSNERTDETIQGRNRAGSKRHGQTRRRHRRPEDAVVWGSIA